MSGMIPVLLAAHKAGGGDDSAFYIILFAIGAVVFVIASVSQWFNSQAQQKRLVQRDAKNRETFKAYVEAIQGDQLPAVQSNILLKAGECAYYCEAAALYEERSVRQYQSGMAGFRVAKGVWIGGSQGRSTSIPTLREIDTGMLTVTNLRVVFSGTRESRSIAIKKIMAISQGCDAVQVSIEGRQKNLIFTADNPYFLNLALQYVGGALQSGKANS